MSENITASANLSRIVERIQVLESLYNHVLKLDESKNQKPGLGHKNETVTIQLQTPRGEIPVPSLTRINKRPKTFQETLDLIGVFLIFLSGQKLSQEQTDILGDISNDLANALAFNEFNGKLNFDKIVEPYIQWLSSI